MESSSDVGCNVGTCCANLSSFNICSSVVLPALSSPKNSNLPDFFHSPRNKDKMSFVCKQRNKAQCPTYSLFGTHPNSLRHQWTNPRWTSSLYLLCRAKKNTLKVDGHWKSSWVKDWKIWNLINYATINGFISMIELMSESEIENLLNTHWLQQQRKFTSLDFFL